MNKHREALLILASKLGLSNEDKVISKAAEFQRLLQIKFAAGSKMSDTSRFVICLDLAANMLGTELDRKILLKYSGLKGPVYSSSKRMIENILELNNNIITTASLSMTLQCTNAQELADEILLKYQEKKMGENLPQYICMAVYQACRIKNIKISKSNVIEKSTLKPSQWTKLEAEWTEFVNKYFTQAENKHSPVLKEYNKNQDTIEYMETDGLQNEEPTEPQTEPYEDWKQRMLEKARRELFLKRGLVNDKIERNIIPRRSPRKTPQSSPYKSPNITKHIKLLSFEE